MKPDRSGARPKSLLRLRPNPRRLSVTKEFEMDHVRIAAHRTVFDIHLFAAARAVQRNHDLLPATRAGIRPFIQSPPASLLPLPHSAMLAPRSRDTKLTNENESCAIGRSDDCTPQPH